MPLLLIVCFSSTARIKILLQHPIVIMTSYLIDFSYRAVQNNYKQLVTNLESFQAISLVFVSWYNNWESSLGSMTS